MKEEFIKPCDMVKVKVVKEEVTIYNINTCNRKQTIKRLRNGKHAILSTGEIVDEKKSLKRGENLKQLIQSNLQLQDLIKENSINLDKILLLTLTYKHKTLDTEQIDDDFNAFMKRLRRKVVEFGAIEFINVYEFYRDLQGYHIHAILFFNESTRKVFVPVETILKAWKKGDVSVGAPTNFGYYYYLTPHLSKEVNDKNSHLHEKALLQMELPANSKLYRHSKGIKKPLIHTDTYENVKKYLDENKYVLEKESVYINPMKTTNGNNLYYCKRYYKKEKETTTLGRRKPI